jgi:hypothetical protein
MRTLILGFSAVVGLLGVTCGDDKNTSDSDTSTGGTASASTSTGDATGTTGGSSGDGGVTEPTTAGESDTTNMGGTESGTTGEATTHTSHATTHTSHATTGESSSSEGSSDDSGTDGESSGTSGGVDPAGTAVVEDSCAPNDGAALLFRLAVTEPVCGAQDKGEKLHIFFWEGAPLAPGSYPITEGMGFASYQVGNKEPINSVDGTLTIDSWVGDLVIGSYELTFVDDSVREGVFAGPFCDLNPPCG